MIRSSTTTIILSVVLRLHREQKITALLSAPKSGDGIAFDDEESIPLLFHVADCVGSCGHLFRGCQSIVMRLHWITNRSYLDSIVIAAIPLGKCVGDGGFFSIWQKGLILNVTERPKPATEDVGEIFHP